MSGEDVPIILSAKAKAIAHYSRVKHTCDCCIYGCKDQVQKYFNDEVALPFFEDGKVLYYMRNPFLIPNPKRNQLQNVLIRQIYRRYCTILRVPKPKTLAGVKIALWHFHPRSIHAYRAYCSNFESSKKRKYPDPFLRFLLPKCLVVGDQLGFTFRDIDAINCIGTNIQHLPCRTAKKCTCGLYVNIPFMSLNRSGALHSLNTKRNERAEDRTLVRAVNATITQEVATRQHTDIRDSSVLRIDCTAVHRFLSRADGKKTEKPVRVRKDLISDSESPKKAKLKLHRLMEENKQLKARLRVCEQDRRCEKRKRRGEKRVLKRSLSVIDAELEETNLNNALMVEEKLMQHSEYTEDEVGVVELTDDQIQRLGLCRFSLVCKRWHAMQHHSVQELFGPFHDFEEMLSYFGALFEELLPDIERLNEIGAAKFKKTILLYLSIVL